MNTLRARLPAIAPLLLPPLLAVAMTGFCAALILAALGLPVADGLTALFVTPVADRWGLSELVLKATPLLLIATGLCICFRAGIWNIGAEGQFVLGALCAGAVALQSASLGAWALPAAVVIGVLAGMALAALAAGLRTHFGASEILTTIMLNYIAIGLLTWSVHGPLRDPAGFNFPESAMFDASAQLQPLLGDYRVTLATPLALLAVAALWWMQRGTLVGYQLDVLGKDTQAAAFAGFSARRMTWFALLASGGLAGLAGATEVTGPVGQLSAHVAFGYGYGAIIVAFIGRLNPAGIVAASLLLALTYLGGENLQVETGVSRSVSAVLQGLMLFFLLAFDRLLQARATRATSTNLTTAAA
jgi:simple sugar transport system permease protein